MLESPGSVITGKLSPVRKPLIPLCQRTIEVTADHVEVLSRADPLPPVNGCWLSEDIRRYRYLDLREDMHRVSLRRKCAALRRHMTAQAAGFQTPFTLPRGARDFLCLSLHLVPFAAPSPPTI